MKNQELINEVHDQASKIISIAQRLLEIKEAKTSQSYETILNMNNACANFISNIIKAQYYKDKTKKLKCNLLKIKQLVNLVFL